MTDTAPSTGLSSVKQAYLAIEKLTARLAAAERGAREPIAIVGMGCRFPGGADSPTAFWELIAGGTDAVTEVPPDRWNVDAYYDPDVDAPGKMNTRFGAFVRDIDRFDPAFFGISPREAMSMDPQQRVLLEVAWEALEHAGQAPDRLAESATGVFVGIVGNDYAQLQLQNGAMGSDTYYGSGVGHSVASGRISYTLGLQGPSVSVDTACSSSLVAVHLAVQSLRARECRMALAAGTNAVLAPEMTVALAKYHMLAPDGRCKTFDARADGFVRGEGVGVVVLKRLSDAIADGDRVLAVIRGSAVNQDGPSSGLTAPNGPSQTEVIRQALTNAGAAPSDVAYIEAHGTGTALGDPIEVQAISAALGEGRAADAPVWVGSVKTNIGHLEAAAGVAGLIKTVLCLHHRALPPHLHFETPSPFIPWAKLPVRVPTALTPFPTESGTLCGVSSFGFSGTNAHLIIGPPPSAADVVTDVVASDVERPRHLLTLSAANESALRALAERDANALGDGVSLADAAFTANTGRGTHTHRAAVIAETTDAARAALRALANGTAVDATSGAAALTGHRRTTDEPKIAFLFTGQGSQYPGMGAALYRAQPTFRAAIDQCDAILRAELTRPLTTILFPSDADDAAAIHDTTYTQPALFAFEYAMAELLESWGIHPTVSVGHSVGELVAATRAGVFSLDDGLRLVAARGRLMGALPAGGGMTAIFADGDLVHGVLATHPTVSVAAVNGPANTVIAGPLADVQRAAEDFASRGVTSQPLVVSHAFHSALMEPMLDEFAHIAAGVTYGKPQRKVISNLTGAIADANTMGRADYWRRHVREPVQFAAAMRTLAAQGITTFIEIGPHPVLLGLGQTTLDAPDTLWLPTSRRGKDDWESLLTSVGQWWVRGGSVDWTGFDRDYARRKVALPTYPFQRARYWTKPAPTLMRGTTIHPILGRRIRSAMPNVTHFEASLRADTFGFLHDHHVGGRAIMPATGFLEMALAAAHALFGAARAIEDVVIREPLAFVGDDARAVQLIAALDDRGGAQLTIASIDDADEAGATPWRIHAEARLAQTDLVPPAIPDGAAIMARCDEQVTADAHYAELAARGLTFGPSLRGVKTVHRRDGEAIAELVPPTEIGGELGRYHIHPALLDAAIQPLGDAMPTALRQQGPYLPLAIERVTVFRAAGAGARSHVTLAASGEGRTDTLHASVHLFDDAGTIARVEGLALRRMAPSAARAAELSNTLYEIAWRPMGTGAATTFPAPAALREPVAAAWPTLTAAHDLVHYHRAFERTERMVTAYIVRALERIGFSFVVGKRHAAAGLAEQLGVAARYTRLLDRLLAILAEDGVLERQDGAWIVVAAPTTVDPDAEAAALLAEHPDARARTTLAMRCGVDLAGVLRGTTDALQLLFPGGSADEAESLYQKAPEAAVYNGLLRAAVSRLVESLPEGQRLRVLEVGGGTGATTSWVTPVLPADRTDYLFTDIGPLLVERARQKFADRPFMRFQPLDLERDPGAQGLEDGTFDLVIAVNVIHATADLRETLRHLDRVLAPGGTVLMLEVAGLERWIDVTFGLTDGWWRFTDTDRRPDYPLLSRAQWGTLFESIGYDALDLAAPTELSRETLIAARKPATGAATFDNAGSWLVFADARGAAAAFAQRLVRHGQEVRLVRPGTRYAAHSPHDIEIDPTRPDDYRRLLDETGDGVRGVLHFWSLDLGLTDDTSIGTPIESQRTLLDPVVSIVQALGARSFGAGATPRLWLVTHGAQPVTEGVPIVPAAATLWGVGRSLALEHPELRPTRIDLDPAHRADTQADALAALVAQDGVEDELAVRDGRAHVARVARAVVTTHAERSTETATARRLEKSATGVFDDMTLRPVDRRPPGPGEIELRVRAAGLNFRDVMNAVAMRDDPEPLGGECAGRVVAVGAGVTEIAVGDDVVATGLGCFGTYLTTGAVFAAAKPATLDYAEAATVPFAFMTAHYALTLAGLRAGETVLIHAGAGGVGMAAIQLAKRLGATIIATAGSEEKRDYLRAIGVPYVFDSRSLAFADEVRAVTNDAGVDVVLNSLAGDFIPASVGTLTPHGRFLEIGKRDIWTDAQFKAVRPDGAYHAIDLNAQRYADPAAATALFAEVMGMAESGEITPLPSRIFPLTRAAEAFRHMAQARHIGKIVLTDDAPEFAALDAVSPDATYLVTGGLTGLGLLTAERMVALGARTLVLVGRRAPSEDASAAIRRLEDAGARAIVRSVDVSDPTQIGALIDEIDRTLPPLRGVVHSAGALDDRALLQQSWPSFAVPLGPKVAGAWALHVLTRRHALDFFVMYSSAASLLGSSGQSNHAAANAFLDALAHHRRRLGLAGLSINWGPWSGVGAAVERNVGARAAGRGIGSIAPALGLAALELLMASDTAQAGVVPIDWPTFLAPYGTSVPAWFTDVRAAATPGSARGAPRAHGGKAPIAPGLRDELAQATPGRRRELLFEFVAENVGRVLGTEDAGAIDPDKPLNELGLDSLMAVELRNRLGAGLALPRSLPATLVFDHPTITALTTYLDTDVLGASAAPVAGSAAASPAADMVGSIEELTDEQIDALFAKNMRST